MNWPLITMIIETEADVVAVRQRARQLAELLGFERQAQTRIATAVSEIARNAVCHAKQGEAKFSVRADESRPIFLVRIGDRGKGIADLDAVLESGRRPGEGGSLGLTSARRLADFFRVKSELGKGTVVELGQVLPAHNGKLTRSRIREIARSLAAVQSKDHLTIICEQNRELLQSLEQLRQQQDETDQLAKELGDTNRGVVALYAELDGRAEQLRQASETKSRFLSNMSHEFRTPLNSILALSQLLLDRADGQLTQEQEKQVSYIRGSGEGLLNLVNDLLDLAKVEAGKLDIKPVRVAIPDLFGALRGSLKPLMANPAVELTFTIEPDVPELLTDEQKVAQILRNLISNALKFTEAGEVSVSANYDAEERRVTFSVRDTGIGIAPEDQERIFEEFTQVNTTLQHRTKGTGLGLPLSRNLAILLGGDIQLESVTGQGSVFRLLIPARVDQELATTRADPANNRKRVLIIDDDETFRYVFRQILGGDLDFEVLEAGNGAEGLVRARCDRPDLIVLDLQMPVMDGFTALAEIQADQALNQIPVVISTSLKLTSALRARLPAGITVLSKSDLSRAELMKILPDVSRL